MAVEQDDFPNVDQTKGTKKGAKIVDGTPYDNHKDRTSKVEEAIKVAKRIV